MFLKLIGWIDAQLHSRSKRHSIVESNSCRQALLPHIKPIILFIPANIRGKRKLKSIIELLPSNRSFPVKNLSKKVPQNMWPNKHWNLAMCKVITQDQWNIICSYPYLQTEWQCFTIVPMIMMWQCLKCQYYIWLMESCMDESYRHPTPCA